MIKKHPNLHVCGAFWGYFEKEGDENRRVLGMIRACRPDILLVCFGFPMQEYWIRDNLHLLPSVRVAAGLGGSLDVWAGRVRRAPVFLQNSGLEWAWRMAADPKRIKQLPHMFRFAKTKVMGEKVVGEKVVGEKVMGEKVVGFAHTHLNPF